MFGKNFFRRLLRYSHSTVTQHVETIVAVLGVSGNKLPHEITLEHGASEYSIFELGDFKIVRTNPTRRSYSKDYVFFLHNEVWTEVYRKEREEEIPFIFRYGAWVDKLVELGIDAKNKQRKRTETENAYRYGALE